MSKWKQLGVVLAGALASGVLLLSACGGGLASTATPVPTPTLAPTATPEPTPTRNLADQAEALAEEIARALRAALAEVDSLDELSEELSGHLCDVAAGNHEPYLALGDFTDNLVLQTGIRSYCASR